MPVNEDLDLYDCANIYIAFNGVSFQGSIQLVIPQNFVLGELWIDYEIDFVVPIGKTSLKQIANIETLTTSGGGTRSVLLPYGNSLLGSLLGSLGSAGLKYIQSNTSGHYLGTNKSIVKEFTGWLVGTVGAPLVPFINVFTGASNSGLDDNSLGLLETETDFTALVADIDAGITNNFAKYAPVTLSTWYNNGSPLSIGTIPILNEHNDTNKIRMFRFWVKAPAGSVINITGAGVEVPTSGSFTLTDSNWPYGAAYIIGNSITYDFLDP